MNIIINPWFLQSLSYRSKNIEVLMNNNVMNFIDSEIQSLIFCDVTIVDSKILFKSPVLKLSIILIQ